MLVSGTVVTAAPVGATVYAILYFHLQIPQADLRRGSGSKMDVREQELPWIVRMGVELTWVLKNDALLS
jgi:hypothetical protein